MRLSDLTPLTLESLSSIACSFRRGRSRIVTYADILVVSFRGKYRPGSAGTPDARFMLAMAEAGIAAFDPLALILDLRDLEYEWGDDLDLLFGAGSSRDSTFPVATVVGTSCAEAVRTLCLGVSSSESLETINGLFRDIDSAWSYLDATLAANQAQDRA